MSNNVMTGHSTADLEARLATLEAEFASDPDVRRATADEVVETERAIASEQARFVAQSGGEYRTEVPEGLRQAIEAKRLTREAAERRRRAKFRPRYVALQREAAQKQFQAMVALAPIATLVDAIESAARRAGTVLPQLAERGFTDEFMLRERARLAGIDLE